MAAWLKKRRTGPIGVDIGSHSVKLVQLDVEGAEIWESARWELPRTVAADSNALDQIVVDAIRQAREGRNFRGREAVFCLGAPALFVQNIRVPQTTAEDLPKVVRMEVAERLPFDAAKAEIRFLETVEVRQANGTRREVVVLACPQIAIDRLLDIAEQSALTPTAIDVAPAAMLRAYVRQFRRDDDRESLAMFVNLGASTSVAVIGRGADVMFVKYLGVGGRHFDEAVAKHLHMDLAEAAALRKQHSDRRADQHDPEVAQTMSEAVRPVVEQLAAELALCIRYHSVTFRGLRLSQLVLSGGEANQSLADWLAPRLDLTCDVGDPVRNFRQTPPGRAGQWDVATGLAMRSAL